MSTPPRRETGHESGRREKKAGSRILLAAALAGGLLGALIVGAWISDFLCNLLEVESNAVRLGMKVGIIVLALPAGFYLVERCFLSRANREDGKGAGRRG